MISTSTGNTVKAVPVKEGTRYYATTATEEQWPADLF